MKDWMKRIGGVVGMGLAWGVVWAAVGALVRIADPSGFTDGAWLGPAIGLYPGMVCGLLFSVAIGISTSWRRLDEVSPSAVVACGGMAGLLVGVLPFVINEPTSEAPLWLVGVVVIGSMTLLGAVCAAGSRSLAGALERHLESGRR